MQYLLKCLFAIVTPWGRLPVGPFAVFAFLIIALHCIIQMYITSMGEDLPPYNAWSMALIVLMWPTFCVTSRRFHDSGKTAFYLVPLLIVTFASYLAVLDDLHLATSVFEEDRDLLRWAERVRFALQIAGMAAMIAALVRPGDDGDNAFGPVFHDAREAAAHLAASPAKPTPAKPKPTERRQAALQPTVQRSATAHGSLPETSRADGTAPTPRRRAEDLRPTGPRGRITPSDMVRNRGEGFGRR